MRVSLAFLTLGIMQLHVVSSQSCAKKSTTTCKLEGIDRCTSNMKNTKNNLTVFSECLLSYNSIDDLINCTGDNDEQLCVSTEPIASHSLKVSLDRGDGEKDQCWCFKARGVLYLAALNKGCLVEDYFEICPQKDIGGFRNCLCHRAVSTKDIECLAEQLNLKHAEPDFSKQCRRKRPKPSRPAIRAISSVSPRDGDSSNASGTSELVKRAETRTETSSHLPNTTAATTPSVQSGTASTTSGTPSTSASGSASSCHRNVSWGLMGLVLLMLTLFCL